MAQGRRVFLKVVGVGMAGTAVNLSCTGVVGDSGSGNPGAGTAGGNGGPGGEIGATGGASGTGGLTGAGGDRSNGAGGFADTGAGGSGTGGSGAGVGDAGVTGPRDAATDRGRDIGPAGDAGPILGPGDVLGGNVSSLVVGSLNAIPGQTIAVGRDAMGVYALTLICTHAGCTAAPATTNGARQINCPCHGSQFDRNGAVIRGPAARPLVHFSVTIDAVGNVIVHSSSQVAATVRVMA